MSYMQSRTGLLVCSHSCSFQGATAVARDVSLEQEAKASNPNNFCGGFGEREIPVPIPNTAVKPPSADDTARATLWESKSPPRSFKNSPLQSKRAVLFCPLFLAGIESNFCNLDRQVVREALILVHKQEWLRSGLKSMWSVY